MDVYYRPGEGRLNNSHAVGLGSGAWCSGPQDKAPYLQVYLGSSRKVTAVSTQGHPVLHKWVTMFRLSYSLNGVTWIKTNEVYLKCFLLTVNANTFLPILMIIMQKLPITSGNSCGIDQLIKGAKYEIGYPVHVWDCSLIQESNRGTRIRVGRALVNILKQKIV